MALGLLIIRLALGLVLTAHGAQKLFKWFGGHGIAGTGKFFESMGFRPGRLFATLAGLGEFAGGLGLALGFLTPLAAAAVIATMLVAIFAVHAPKGFFSSAGGFEFPLLVAAGAATLGFTGPGAVSIDALLGAPLAGAWWGLGAVALGALGAAGSLLVRSRAQETARPAAAQGTPASRAAA